jgi:DNA gyrase/topoisomerase IV subunit A
MNMTDQVKLNAAFSELDFEDDMAVNVIMYQTEAEHLKAEIAELHRILAEHELQLRIKNEMIAEIHKALGTL